MLTFMYALVPNSCACHTAPKRAAAKRLVGRRVLLCAANFAAENEFSNTLF